MKMTKLDAAKKQLDFAVNGYFHGYDLAILFPIAGAAHVLTHDLMEASQKGNSWVSLTNSNSTILIKEKLKELRSSYNWFKHANNDSESKICGSFIELENLLMTSILDWTELTESPGSSSKAIYAFYIWFIAKNISVFETLCDPELISHAMSCFPNICSLSAENQRKEGLIYLKQQ